MRFRITHGKNDQSVIAGRSLAAYEGLKVIILANVVNMIAVVGLEFFHLLCNIDVGTYGKLKMLEFCI